MYLLCEYVDSNFFCINLSGEYLDLTLQQCVICSGPSFSDRNMQSSCQPCPAYSVASVDGRICICTTQGRLGLVADANSAVSICVDDLAGSERSVYKALVALLLLTVLLVGAVLWRARGSRVVHASSPMFLNIILVCAHCSRVFNEQFVIHNSVHEIYYKMASFQIGVCLIAVSDLILVQPQTPYLCMANVWLTNLAFTACFGAMFVKTFHAFLSLEV